MDSLISAGARALAAGDPIGALKLVALRNDAAGLALRGIALAQLGSTAARASCCVPRRVRSAFEKRSLAHVASLRRRRLRWLLAISALHRRRSNPRALRSKRMAIPPTPRMRGY